MKRMDNSFTDRVELAQYVVGQLLGLRRDLPWTMTITQGRYGVYSARTVIATSSDDTEWMPEGQSS